MLKRYLSVLQRPLYTTATRRMTEPPAKRQKVDKPMQQQGKKRFKNAKAKKVKPGGVEEVLRFDIIELLGKDLVDRSEGEKLAPKYEHLSQVEVDIVALSSHGRSLWCTSIAAN